MKRKHIYHVFYEYNDGSFNVYQTIGLQTAYNFFVSLYDRPEIVRAKIYRPQGMRLTIRSFDRRSELLKKYDSY